MKMAEIGHAYRHLHCHDRHLEFASHSYLEVSKDKVSYKARRTERNDLEVSKDKVSYKARRTEERSRSEQRQGQL